MQNGHYKTLSGRVIIFTIVLSCCSTGVIAEMYELEVIEVTAQKRIESLEDVPISIAVMDGGDIKDYRVDSLFDVASFSPGMIFPKAPDDGGLR